jgi:Dyp-type peroxidase family
VEIRTDIDLHDIQGNITKGYGRFGFPFARYLFFRVNDEACGREFLKQILPLITTGAPWTKYGDRRSGTAKPQVTTNIAFTFEGLRQLGMSEKSLLGFPEEFAVGMRARGPILGDDGPSDPEHWDPIWKNNETRQSVHVLVSLQAKTQKRMEDLYTEILKRQQKANQENNKNPPGRPGVEQLLGHKSENGPAEYQSAQALRDENGNFTDREHFGFVDGISDPYFKDSGTHPDYIAGGGKRIRRFSPQTPKGWEPLANGEFLLGYRDEAKEYPAAPLPALLSRNGTFLVWRKLHQNVAAWTDYLETEGNKYGDPELFAAKLVGRWKNGAPLANFATFAEAEAHRAQVLVANEQRHSTTLTETERNAAERKYYQLKQQLMTFDYEDDVDGQRCPVGSHLRRANPRSGMEFGKKAFNTPDALSSRRRILRRGMPYGTQPQAPHKQSDPAKPDSDEHGLIFVGLCASISRQFEFVQQQWLNYGNDSRLANDRDPLVGNQPPSGGRAVIEYDSLTGREPYFCTNIPRFVETRGGDYFFVPSLSAIESIAAGTIDPT